MPVSPNSSDDVNARAVEEWKDETTPFDRVYAVIRRTYEPQSAAEIAARARVSATTARKHLRTLVDAGAVTTESAGGTTRYQRSETAIITEHAQQLLSEQDTETIASGVAEMKAQINSWREAYDVETPEEFARELTVADADTDHGRVLTEWQTTRRNLALAQAALAIDEATGSGFLSNVISDDGDNDFSAVV